VTDVQAYMGHADIKTTMRYVHHGAEARRRGTLLEVRGGPARRVPVVSRTYAFGHH
jgi:integrase